MVISFTEFLTFFNLVTGCFESVEDEKKTSLPSIYSNFPEEKHSHDLFSKKEICITRQQNVVPVDNLRDFPKPANKPKIYRDPKIKLSARCQKHLFAHCYKDLREHSNNQKLLSFCFEQNNKCLFFIKIYNIQGDHLICSEITNISHHENYSLYKNRYRVSYD